MEVTEIPGIGVVVAPGFPAASLASMWPSVYALPEPDRISVILALVAAANRHRSCAADSEQFPAALVELATDPWPYESSLFSFFTAGLSALECLAFGIHALGHAADPKTFPMETEAQRRAVNIKLTSARLTTARPDDGVTHVVQELVADEAYSDWLIIRNHLSHRTAGGRTLTVVIGGPPIPDQWTMFDVPLVPELTTERLAWLEGWLEALLSSAHLFAQSIVGAGKTPPGG